VVVSAEFLLGLCPCCARPDFLRVEYLKLSPGSAGGIALIEAPRREHSRKPDEAYEHIERMTVGPYIELFARCQRPGWVSWGNEV
jgi:N6-adenosine-specific RNA methylase IME4